MRAAIRIVLDALDNVFARCFALVVDRSDSPSVSSSAVSHDNAAAVVASAFPMTDFGEGQLGVGFAFPKVVIL